MIDHCPITSAHNQYTTFPHSIHTSNILLSHTQYTHQIYYFHTLNTHNQYTTFTLSIDLPLLHTLYSKHSLQIYYFHTLYHTTNQLYLHFTAEQAVESEYEREREKAQSKVVTLLKTLYINTFTYNYVQAYSYSAKRTRIIIRKKRQFLCTCLK